MGFLARAVTGTWVVCTTGSGTHFRLHDQISNSTVSVQPSGEKGRVQKLEEWREFSGGDETEI